MDPNMAEGFHEMEVPFWDPKNKDYNMSGSEVLSPHFGFKVSAYPYRKRSSPPHAPQKKQIVSLCNLGQIIFGVAVFL